MTRTLFALAFLFLTAPAEAQRGTSSQGRGTTSDERACSSDARKFCSRALGDDMAVLRCFQANRRKLSRSCRAVLRKYGQ